jgi:hypothetical protein
MQNSGADPDLIYDAKHLLAGIASGGMWESADNGVSWQPLASTQVASWVAKYNLLNG